MSKSNTSDCLTLRKARWMPALTVSRNSTAVMAEPIERMASYGGGGGRKKREIQVIWILSGCGKLRDFLSSENERQVCVQIIQARKDKWIATYDLACFNQPWLSKLFCSIIRQQSPTSMHDRDLCQHNLLIIVQIAAPSPHK